MLYDYANTGGARRPAGSIYAVLNDTSSSPYPNDDIAVKGSDISPDTTSTTTGASIRAIACDARESLRCDDAI
jgi:hypothetical protein